MTNEAIRYSARGDVMRRLSAEHRVGRRRHCTSLSNDARCQQTARHGGDHARPSNCTHRHVHPRPTPRPCSRAPPQLATGIDIARPRPPLRTAQGRRRSLCQEHERVRFRTNECATTPVKKPGRRHAPASPHQRTCRREGEDREGICLPAAAYCEAGPSLSSRTTCAASPPTLRSCCPAASSLACRANAR